MASDERDQTFWRLLDASADRQDVISSAELEESELAEVQRLVETAEALRPLTYAPPPIEEDPVAAMLGLIPDHECQFDATALRTARVRANLTVSDIARALGRQGWTFSTGDVFRWERGVVGDVPPAVIQAVAAILEIDVVQISTTDASQSENDSFNEVKSSKQFAGLVDRFAAARGIARNVAESALVSNMHATAYRGEPDAEDILGSLELLVAAIERESERSS